MMRHTLAVGLLVLSATQLPAQQPGGKVIRLAVSPSPEMIPALRHALLPDVFDISPGNAAALYYRSFAPEWTALRQMGGDGKGLEKVNKLLETALAELPRSEWNWLLTSPGLREVDLAARKEHCDWAYLERVRSEGFEMLLPELHGLRGIGSLLALRTRLYLADGRFDRAAHSLQTGIGLGRHVGDAPTLISALVGNAILHVQVRQIEEWIQTRGSPNIYWSLAALPRPLISLERPLQAERLGMSSHFSMLKEIETHPFSPAEERTLMNQVVHIIKTVLTTDDKATLHNAEDLKQLVDRSFDAARAALRASNFPEQSLAAMPKLQVYLIHAHREYRRFQDELFKWHALPFAEARVGLERANGLLDEAKKKQIAQPFLDFLPALYKVQLALTRLERRIAALRCVEAIRLHAAAHGGKLPAKLAEISAVPVPLDPVRGAAFEYRVNGGKAVLHAPAVGQKDDPAASLTYEITIRP